MPLPGPRRRDLLAALPALAAAAAPAPAALPMMFRQDVTLLAPDRLASLEAAIGEMQRRSLRDPDDPAGWRAHALVHARACGAAAGSAQVHGSRWFLPWHRAFLAVTERKLRAISGDPSLCLPYWNWSTDRRLPAAFVRPGSPLARATRHGPDRPLRATEVDHLVHDPDLARLGVAALAARAFQASGAHDVAASFGGLARPDPSSVRGRSRLEGIPHAAVHNHVGGVAADGTPGDMTVLATAALDPLFLAHHANLDRLWERWRSDPARRATEPHDPGFTAQVFLFPWLDGTPLAVTVAETLDADGQGSAYDRLHPFRGAPPPRDPPLDATPLTTRLLAVPALPARGGQRLALRIAGILPQDRPMSVEIALSAPDGDPGLATPVGAFACGRHPTPPGCPDTEIRLDVTAALRRLGTRTVAVSILPLSLGAAAPAPFGSDAMDILPV